MGRIVSAYIMPHPPIVVPEVGKGEEAKALKTYTAFKRAAAEIGRERPTTIILTSPHGPMFQDFIHISLTPVVKGNLSRFGAGNVMMEYENNLDLVDRIVRLAQLEGIACGGIDDKTAGKYGIQRDLDHGATVPLYFINKEYSGFKLVHISISGLSHREHYTFGRCIADAVRETGHNGKEEERVIFIASGDLSHRLLKEGNYGFHENGPRFDKLLVESVRDNKPENLLALDENFCEGAGECGLRSFIIMYGAFDGIKLKSEVYSYEGPFGVGYSVARLDPLEASGDSLLKVPDASLAGKTEDIRLGEDTYVALARKTLETYVRTGKTVEIPSGLPDELIKKQAGVFVSIKKEGRLRGCIGTISAIRRNIAEEIIFNAISSGTHDPRFEPVKENELASLVYSVDVLGDAEPIASIKELDVIRYGVIVRSGMRSGLLLPNLEGVDDPEAQVSIALQKAGIRPGEKYTMERFEVIRHK
ncbi:MAG: AmmeMemoRadiSam system protein A [Clostridiales bacterium]|nr:AmmeMemoRadiSam system protein A [Clostridiales bacterium]